MRDLAGNTNGGDTRTLIEVADTLKPTTVGISIDYNNGHVTFSMSETMDYQLVNATFMNIFNDTSTPGVSLKGATVVSTADSTDMVVKLTEPQRVFAIINSGTTGGDNHSVLINFDENALADAATNTLSPVIFTNVTETSDTVRPTLVSVLTDFGHGVIKLTFSEAIDSIPNTPSGVAKPVLLDRIFIGNTLNDPQGFNLLNGGRVYVEQRNETVVIKVSEVLRARIIAIGGLVGGDGTASFVNVLDGAVRDVANNPNVAGGFQAEERPDTIGPNMEQVTMHLNNGAVIILADETVDATPASQVHTNKMFLGDDSLCLRERDIIPAAHAILR